MKDEDIDNGWAGTYFLNKDKSCSRCSTAKWGYQRAEMNKNNTKHVGNDEIEGKKVSTVWLGLDHQYDDGPPLLFETMVFDAGSYDELYCKRYSSWNDALEGHKKAIEWVKEGCKDED